MDNPKSPGQMKSALPSRANWSPSARAILHILNRFFFLDVGVIVPHRNNDLAHLLPPPARSPREHDGVIHQRGEEHFAKFCSAGAASLDSSVAQCQGRLLSASTTTHRRSSIGCQQARSKQLVRSLQPYPPQPSASPELRQPHPSQRRDRRIRSPAPRSAAAAGRP